jgi:transcriptional regulator with XRE-family HTH domain
MSQEELAIKVGYTSRSSVAKIEANANGMVQSRLILFAKALQTTPACLMGYDVMKTKEQEQLIDIILKLNNEEVKELRILADYVLSKRK